MVDSRLITKIKRNHFIIIWRDKFILSHDSQIYQKQILQYKVSILLTEYQQKHRIC